MAQHPPPDVLAVFDAMPKPQRIRLRAIRELIFAAADATGTAPLTETLKWGQPAYLPLRKHGTTVRLGWKPASLDLCGLYVHCQTGLIDRFRQLYPDEFAYEGNRAVLIPVAGAFAEAALQQVAAMALTYHRDKRRVQVNPGASAPRIHCRK